MNKYNVGFLITQESYGDGTSGASGLHYCIKAKNKKSAINKGKIQYKKDYKNQSYVSISCNKIIDK